MESLLTYLHMVPLPMALLLSILLNVLIAISGVLPSAFLTAANVAVFGFWGGFSVSLIGEILGSLVAFVLYRKGFQKAITDKSKHAPRLQKLLHASPKEAFWFVIGLRMMPFVPSGLVTLYASVSTLRFGAFGIASSIGKLPALLLETSATFALVKWTQAGQYLIYVLAIVLLWRIWKIFKNPQS